MILSCLFNPDEMDYGSWLTVSGFTMAVLIFFMSVFYDRYEKSRTTKTQQDTKRFYETVWITISIIFFCTILGILLFIFNQEKSGAILMTIVLITIMFFVPLLPYTRAIFDHFAEKQIERIIEKEIHPNLKFPMKKRCLYPLFHRFTR